MTELVRLLDSSDDELERALLLSVQTEVPERAGLQDTALALGLAAPAAHALAHAVTASLAHAVHEHAAITAGSLSAPVATSAAAPLGVASVTTAGKFLVSGALMSFLAMTTLDRTLGPLAGPAARPAAATQQHAAPAATAKGRPSPPPPTLVTPIASPEPTLIEVAPAPERNRHRSPPLEREPIVNAPQVLPPPPPIAEAPPRPAPPPAAPQGAPAPTATSPMQASLAAEIRLLDRTRAALATGDAAEAQRRLDAYVSSHPSGVLAREADLLRIQTLVKLGERHAAAELARRIIRQHPESTHADSLRNLAAEP